MALARWLETDTNSNKDISAAVSIGAYTADADRMVVVDVSLAEIAGNGDYIIYVTRQINGAGSAYVMLPKTTCAAASGETAIAMQSGPITVRSGDVLTVMVDGLAGDTATPDTTVRWFEMATLKPTTADRSLDVAATGEAGLDFDNIKAATGATTLTNITVPTVTTLTGHTAQTGDAYARLGAPAGASVSADIAAVKSDTAAVLEDTGTTLDTLIKDIPNNAEFEARTLVAADYTVVSDLPAAAPTAADVADAVWDEAIAGHADAGSTGAALAGATAPAAADVADAVWDELLAGHTDAGSAGAGLAAAGSAGDPWSTVLPGSYGASTAGQIIGDTLGGATGSVIYTEGATLDDLLDELADTHGDGSWEGGGAGVGTGSYTDTVTDDDSNPLDGVRVQLSTDSAGTNVVYEGYTDALGVFTLRPDPGTYYRWLDLAGYTFTQGVEVEVS